MRLSIRSAAVLAAASVSFGFVASAARADFIFSNQRSTVTIGGTNYDRVTFFARNDGTGYTAGGSKLQGMDATVTSTGVMRFETGHVGDTLFPNPDGSIGTIETDTGLDIDLNAPTAAIAAGNLEYSKVIAECFTDANLALFPTSPKTNSSGGFNPVAAYTNLKSFNAIGVALGTAAAVPAGTGNGAAIATILTTPGASITITGQIGGDTGNAGTLNPAEVILPSGAAAPAIAAAPAADVYRTYAYTAVAPEPTTLAAVALLAPLARRRRRGN